VFRGNNRKPLYLSVKAPKTGTVADVKAAIQDLRPGLYLPSSTTPALQVHAEDLWVCRQYREGGLSEEVPDDTPLTQVKESDQVIVFQLPPMATFQLQAPETVQVRWGHACAGVKHVRHALWHPCPLCAPHPAPGHDVSTHAHKHTHPGAPPHTDTPPHTPHPSPLASPLGSPCLLTMTAGCALPTSSIYCCHPCVLCGSHTRWAPLWMRDGRAGSACSPGLSLP
jgi:hypothetical protein